MARSEPQLNFRCPPELRAQLEAAAASAQRSLTQEIVRRLNGTFTGATGSEEDAEAVAIDLSDPSDRAAIMRVLLLSEVMLLRNRVQRLGGKSTVLTMSKREIADRVDDGQVGTRNERATHFSTVLESWPLTALLTTGEIRKLADRVVAIQSLPSAVQDASEGSDSTGRLVGGSGKSAD
jgi:hypothetical protein